MILLPRRTIGCQYGMNVRGCAWGMDGEVDKVFVSEDVEDVGE